MQVKEPQCNYNCNFVFQLAVVYVTRGQMEVGCWSKRLDKMGRQRPRRMCCSNNKRLENSVVLGWVQRLWSGADVRSCSQATGLIGSIPATGS